MPLSPPPPPSITPTQMNLLRIVASMAWSDGHLAEEEVDIMLDRFSKLFSNNKTQQDVLRNELRDYLIQNIPLEESIPKLTTNEQRELVLRLGYEVIQSSARTSDEPPINLEEAAAYKRLVGLLKLPAETVQRIEAEFTNAPPKSTGMVETLARELKAFIHE